MNRDSINIQGVIFSFKKITKNEYSEFITYNDLSFNRVIKMFDILIIELENKKDINKDTWDCLYELLLSFLFYYPSIILCS